MAACQAGSEALLIFLGKQMLGQTDRQALEQSDPDGQPVPLHLTVSFVRPAATLTSDDLS
jgi:hypothetical protein